MNKTIYGNVFALLMIAGFSSGCFEKQWESEVTSNPSVAKVSANNLCMAFDSDKSSANKEYKGKIITVHGLVQEMQDEAEKVIVVVRNETGGEVYCSVSALHSADLDDLKVGSPVMIKGKCRGIVRGNITLGGCVIDDPLRELKAKAKSGDAPAQMELAKALAETADEVRDVRRSFHIYCKVADTGHEGAQGTVSKALMGAWRPETNLPVIWNWLREEAEKGNTEACYLLGMLYNIDEDFGIDPEASVPWFRKASDGGHQEAMFTMAMFHYGGKLVPTNKTETVRLLSLVNPTRLPIACEVLGIMYFDGDGVPRDISKAVGLLATAAQNGRSQAAAILGDIYWRGEDVSKDDQRAEQWFLKASELGDIPSMAKAGLIISSSEDVSTRKRSRELIVAALSNDMEVAYAEIHSYAADSVRQGIAKRNPLMATNTVVQLRRIDGALVRGVVYEIKDAGLIIGDERAFISFVSLDLASRLQCDLGLRELFCRSLAAEKTFGLMAGFKPPEAKESTNDVMNSLMKMAETGNIDAQAWLGSLQLENSNTEEGLGWLEKAANAGAAYGQYALGLAYFKGTGLKQDKAEALRLFKLASDQDSSAAQLEAGRMLMLGDGCERDQGGGLELVRRSADNLELDAILFLGRYYYGDEKRGSRDAAQAFAWFRLGAVMLMPEAQYWLGRMYYEGKGVPKDYNRAIQWLVESAKQGYQPAAVYLNGDEARKKEMASARQAYQQELERHANQLEQIRQNPKYDLVNYAANVPRRFARNSREREAYRRFSHNFMSGMSMRTAAAEAWDYVGGNSSRSSWSKRGDMSGGGAGGNGSYRGNRTVGDREYFGGFTKPAYSEAEFKQRINWLQQNYPYEDPETRQRYRIKGQSNAHSSGDSQQAKIQAADSCVQSLINRGTLLGAQRIPANDQVNTVAYRFRFSTKAGLFRQYDGYIYLEPRQGGWAVVVINMDGRDIRVD